MNKRIVLFTLTTLLLLSLSQSGFAKTVISKSDCGISVTMKIAFYGAGAKKEKVDGWMIWSIN